MAARAPIAGTRTDWRGSPTTICFALALWNGCDPILKERLFGLAGPEGNHGEDVKEYYFYLDSTPSHSWMRMLYKYPQRVYPYADLVAENTRRGKDDPEYELLDTGIFDDDRYFDVFVEYAKAGADDILIRIRAINRGPEPAPLHILLPVPSSRQERSAPALYRAFTPVTALLTVWRRSSFSCKAFNTSRAPSVGTCTRTTATSTAGSVSALGYSR